MSCAVGCCVVSLFSAPELGNSAEILLEWLEGDVGGVVCWGCGDILDTCRSRHTWDSDTSFLVESHGNREHTVVQTWGRLDCASATTPSWRYALLVGASQTGSDFLGTDSRRADDY
mmetsp:Transcript_1209/g.1904  ORF Transcript_1209/g.1904 Transcript_1209/m.1904 type:complete len:116 (-) Transcript_1209:4699-5046(-)